MSSVELNEEFAKNNSTVLSGVVVAVADLLIHPEKKAELKDKICVVDKQATRHDLEAILSYVTKIYGVEDACEFKQAANKQFPLASAFLPENQQTKETEDEDAN